MAALVDNKCYLTLGGTSVGTYFRKVKGNFKNNTKERTAGSGTTHVQRAAGLDDYTFDITLIYDASNLQTYLQKLKPGTVEVMEWGPELNVTGKPRHVQSIIIDEAPFEVDVEKNLVVFEVKASGEDAPSVNLWTGAVYP